jgi:hypothetical protein
LAYNPVKKEDRDGAQRGTETYALLNAIPSFFKLFMFGVNTPMASDLSWSAMIIMTGIFSDFWAMEVRQFTRPTKSVKNLYEKFMELIEL